MSTIFYHLFRWCYPLLLRIASPFHPKARAWVQGRSGLLDRIERLKGKGPFVWVHCASLGEFEQGRPVIEAIRTNFPKHRILLTFFSPSGYEHTQHFKGADHIFYLPMDGPQNARRFIEAIEPTLVIFVKYEFWFYYLKKLHYRKIPLLLISAFFRPDMSFFKWYGALSRKMLTRFDKIFVQDSDSLELLRQIGQDRHALVGGDTRFDRVTTIAQITAPLPEIDRFVGTDKAIVVGSSWPADEQLWSAIQDWLNENKIKLLIVPHEIDPVHLEQTQNKFKEAHLYSELDTIANLNRSVLIVDRMGLLAGLYRYGWVNYVGGGLNSGGVHNVLEAAVYGRPVITGPRIEKYREAVELKNEQGLYPLNAEDAIRELKDLLTVWLQQPTRANEIGQKAAQYVHERTGAVDRILSYIQENRLLTN